MRVIPIYVFFVLAVGCKPSAPPAPENAPAPAPALPATPSAADEPPTAEALAVAANRRGFNLDLYAQVAAAEKGNVCVSPMSIRTTLAMTRAGARGDTEAEVRRVLDLLPGLARDPGLQTLVQRLSTGQAAGTELRSASAVWGQQGLRWQADFRTAVVHDFGAAVFDANFQSRPDLVRQQINAWAEKQTQGKVTDLIPDGRLTPNHRLVLANALYFKGPWANKFDPARTRPAPFTRADGTQVDVPMMRRKGGFRMRHIPAAGDDPAVSVAVIPYKGNQASMAIVLPAKPDGLPDLERRLTPAVLHRWIDSAPPQSEAELVVPKFKVEGGSDLKRPLRALGINRLFDPDGADLSGMHSGKDRLYVDFVAHKAVVEVNEDGTEAAAGTGVGSKKKDGPPPDFVADRPFLFLISAVPSDNVLFIGRYVGP